MTFDMVVVDSHVVLPHGIIDKNIVINDGKIVKYTTDIPSCNYKINGAGLVSVPGPIDAHVHYGVYSPIDQAAVTESHAAAIGGVTTMMRMLRLNGKFSTCLPPQLDASLSSHHIDYTAHASIFTEQQVNEMNYCVENKITSFKIYMNLAGEVGHVYMDMQPESFKLQETKVDVTNNIVEETVKRAASLQCPVLVHAEDYESCACGMKTAKEKQQDGLDAWSKSRDPKYEEKAIETVCKYARKYNCVIYFVHIGSKIALERIRVERSLGTNVYVETCPHYMVLSYETRDDYLAKVMPPIRSTTDNQAVWNAMYSGEINTVGTDHVANKLSLKVGSDVWESLAGFPGIGVSIPILLSEGVNRGRISLHQFTNLTSTNPAKIFSMYPQKGSLVCGYDADITILDMKHEQKVTSDLFGGFSDYSVYEGMMLRGWPVKTIVRGSIIAENFTVIEKPGYGKLVSRKVAPLRPKGPSRELP
ncbi:MAG: amidohydrolase family protein [Cenarchaeum sp. SB0662_bin_33]|nr:amidohydrolase family protein [Cenarchaeum sp. SB0662_bin_33]